MINRLISGSVMAARFQSAPNPHPWVAGRSHRVTNGEAFPFTAATAAPGAGWLAGLVLELTINRTATAIVASGPEVSPA